MAQFFLVLIIIIAMLNQKPSSFFFPPFIFISWRLITLQYCSGFCHTDNPICKTEKETQMYRTDFWTLREKVSVGCFERTLFF